MSKLLPGGDTDTGCVGVRIMQDIEAEVIKIFRTKLEKVDASSEECCAFIQSCLVNMACMFAYEIGATEELIASMAATWFATNSKVKDKSMWN